MIYVFLADGTEELEALTPVDVLRRAGLPVQTVGVGAKIITGSHRIPITCDIRVEEVQKGDCEMVILPGGMPGTTNLELCPQVQSLLETMDAKKGWIAAICAAPSILGNKGLLEGRRAVCYPGYEKHLRGAQVGGEAVCVDGHIVTARGVGAAMLFSLKLAELLTGADTRKLRETMQCLP